MHSQTGPVLAAASVSIILMGALFLLLGFGLLLAWALHQPNIRKAITFIGRCKDYSLLHPIGGRLIYAGFICIALGAAILALILGAFADSL